MEWFLDQGDEAAKNENVQRMILGRQRDRRFVGDSIRKQSVD